VFSVCVCVCVFLCLCTGRGLATSWSPVQEVLPIVPDQETEETQPCAPKAGASSQVWEQRGGRRRKNVDVIRGRSVLTICHMKHIRVCPDWVVIAYSVVDVRQRFGGICCLHLRPNSGDRIRIFSIGNTKVHR
jgi:hypothetical protein